MKSIKSVALTATLILAPPASAQSFDLGGMLGGLLGGSGDLGGLLGGLLSGGGLTGLISMIPGLNFLAGLGPIMDIIGQIPGLSGLLSQIPGLGQLLGFLGGGANLGPLNQQIGNVSKWLTTAQQLYGMVKNLSHPNNYNDFAASANSLLQMAGVNSTVQPSAFQTNPQSAAQSVIDSLTQQQQRVLSKLGTISSPAEYAAVKAQAASLQTLKARAQRTGDNAEAMNNTQELVKQTSERAQDSLSYTQQTAQALKDNKKTEDLLRMVGSAELENLRVAALNSAALTAAMANQMKVEVAQAETLGQILDNLERDRLDKANAIAARLEEQRQQNKLAARQAETYGNNLIRGMNNSMTGASLKNVDLLNGGNSR